MRSRRLLHRGALRAAGVCTGRTQLALTSAAVPRFGARARAGRSERSRRTLVCPLRCFGLPPRRFVARGSHSGSRRPGEYACSIARGDALAAPGQWAATLLPLCSHLCAGLCVRGASCVDTVTFELPCRALAAPSARLAKQSAPRCASTSMSCAMVRPQCLVVLH